MHPIYSNFNGHFMGQNLWILSQMSGVLFFSWIFFTALPLWCHLLTYAVRRISPNKHNGKTASSFRIVSSWRYANARMVTARKLQLETASCRDNCRHHWSNFLATHVYMLHLGQLSEGPTLCQKRWLKAARTGLCASWIWIAHVKQVANI